MLDEFVGECVGPQTQFNKILNQMRVDANELTCQYTTSVEITGVWLEGFIIGQDLTC